MRNTVCVTLFKTLSESEVKEFGNYLTSTYQKSGSVYKLYTYLKKYYPELTNEKLARKYVEKKLFGDKANPERTLFDTTSKLTAKLKSFITVQELEKQEVYNNFLYLEALKSRKLDELFFKKADSLQKEWDDDSIPGIEHFYHQYKLKVLNYSHPNFSIQKIKKESELKNIIDVLDQHHATNKMYYALIYNINNKDTITEKYSAKKILKDFHDKVFPNNTKVNLLLHFLSAYQSNNVNDFKEIKTTFFDLNHHLTQNEKNNLADILKYLFYSKRNEVDVSQEMFEIVKFSLKEKLLFEDGYLSNQTFVNCINIAQANQEVIWIETFIKNYKHLLNVKDRSNYAEFGEIILHIEKEEYENAMKKIVLIKMREPIRVAELNCCKLRCFYEIKYELAFYNALNSAKQYLSNHKQDMAEIHLESFRRFTIAIKEIYKLRIELKINKKNIDSLNLLYKTLKLKNPVYDRKWLLSKVREIQNSLK